MKDSEKFEDNLIIMMCFILLIVTVITVTRNHTLENENYNLHQELIKVRFETQMISETSQISKIIK